ncbi:MFS transporter [Paraburkholderia strydomiana]|uniref:hypothetical protein n=1 Tax=Paraburkholderia strydomiana TaxID=1245417 RepID=UPI00285EB5C4|nr:hypothetical protein [Paraburkholderia strydomiana]MDR7009963.1 putative MFS family arabinose efflux permease [Paraburkholderia strydomiana]
MDRIAPNSPGQALTAWAAMHAASPDLTSYAGHVFARIAQGLIVPLIVRIMLAKAEPRKSEMAAGVVASTVQVGAALGTAAIGGVFSAHRAGIRRAKAMRMPSRVA